MTEDRVVPSKEKKPRSRARPISPSIVARMDELEHRVEGVDKKVEGVLHNQGLNTLVMQRIESKMDAILLLVGSEEEDGDGGFKGVGLLGRMRRVEESQSTLLSKYKTWIAWGGGFITCMSFMVAVLWWLISDKVELVLKGN